MTALARTMTVNIVNIRQPTAASKNGKAAGVWGVGRLARIEPAAEGGGPNTPASQLQR